MLRITYLLLGLTLVSASFVFTDPPNGLPYRLLASSRGGDPGTGLGSALCDEEAGVGNRCTQVGESCTICVTMNAAGQPQNATADKPDPDGPKGETGYERGPNAQDCGNIWNGTCAADPNKPGDFLCVGTDSNQICSMGVNEVKPQPKEVIEDPLDPWQPPHP